MTPAAVFTILIICAVIGVPLGRQKSTWWQGLLFGLLLGPLGLAVLLIMPASRETQVRREQQRMRVQREAAQRESRDNADRAVK